MIRLGCATPLPLIMAQLIMNNLDNLYIYHSTSQLKFNANGDFNRRLW